MLENAARTSKDCTTNPQKLFLTKIKYYCVGYYKIIEFEDQRIHHFKSRLNLELHWESLVKSLFLRLTYLLRGFVRIASAHNIASLNGR